MASQVVLVTGASGFIGSRLARALREAGHRVIGTARDVASLPAEAEPLVADFSRDSEPAIWTPRLQGVDVVINAVGIIRQRRDGEFEGVHASAPAALFAACAAAGVAHVVQVSALGADADAASEYHRSKRRADDVLRGLPLRSTILQPSLVFGEHGASSRSLLALVSLPAIGLARRAARAPVQPVHVEDLVEAIVRVVDEVGIASGSQPTRSMTIAAVGPRAMPFRDYVQALRATLGLPPAPIFTVPRAVIAAFAHLTAGPEALAMLERGNAAPVDAFASLLGHAPRAPEHFVPPDAAPALLTRARLDTLLPALRVSLAVLWVGTALLSFGLYPREQSLALLASVGVPASLQPAALYAGATLDLLLGIGILVRPRWRATWLAQMALMLGYTAILTWRAPEWWLHPFGPLLKNLPLLAATLLVLGLIPARRSR